MIGFRDPEAAARAVDRLEVLTGSPAREFVERSFSSVANPDLALTNLERWLRATTSPDMHFEQMRGLPRLGRLLATVLGASQPVADCLIQNPELASLILEPGQVKTVPTRRGVVEEGEKLLANSTSYLHSLDRLRFLRQRWNLAIVLNDLAGTWPQPTVWRAISDLADALIELAVSVVWAEQRKQRDLPEVCPVLVVGFGKLGGHELNYSSDVDLAYVLPDGTDERRERDITRFCEALGRALTDRMGRGFLYRVDLRLRPYGAAGPIVRSARSVEAYYLNYAESWEVQALHRSRALVGPDDLAERWENMRIKTCFRPKLSETAFEEMVAMRARIEEGANADDIKRGPGGIRDVEFLVQLLQLVHGFAHPNLQVRPTLDALDALRDSAIIDASSALRLSEGYTFLRRLEHRTQMVNDQQTHQLPTSEPARDALARLMDADHWTALEGQLHQHRQSIQGLYRTRLGIEPTAGADRDSVRSTLGPYSGDGLAWLDAMPQSADFYRSLVGSEEALTRVRKILEAAPALLPFFKNSVPLTEMMLSGEIEDAPDDLLSRLSRLSPESPPQSLAIAAQSAYATACVQWLLAPEFDLGARLARQVDEVLIHTATQLKAVFDIVGTGSFGTREFRPGSDADIILMVADKDRQSTAESQAQRWLADLSQLHRQGLPFTVDLRLRPEGGKGLLVRTYEGIRAYDLDGMEMWERFALGHSRFVFGNSRALDTILHSAYGLPLTPERLKELAKMKRRVETERVKPQHVKRNVKLGSGGLNDIEWLVHLHEMRFPSSTRAGDITDMGERILRLARASLLNALEAEVLGEARRFLLDLRTRLALQGAEGDLMPENPDRLDRLARVMDFANGNALLAHYQDVTISVRRLYEEGMERLRAW